MFFSILDVNNGPFFFYDVLPVGLSELASEAGDGLRFVKPRVRSFAPWSRRFKGRETPEGYIRRSNSTNDSSDSANG